MKGGNGSIPLTILPFPLARLEIAWDAADFSIGVGGAFLLAVVFKVLREVLLALVKAGVRVGFVIEGMMWYLEDMGNLEKERKDMMTS